MYKIIFISFFLFLTSCKKSESQKNKSKVNHDSNKIEVNEISTQKIPFDFYFIFNGFVDSYNSKTQIFSRKYNNKIKNVNVEIDNTSLKEIYRIINNENFKNLPSDVNCDYIMTQPQLNLSITISDSNQIYSKNFTVDISGNNCSKVLSIIKIKEILEKSIYEDSKVKNLEMSDILME